MTTCSISATVVVSVGTAIASGAVAMIHVFKRLIQNVHRFSELVVRTFTGFCVQLAGARAPTVQVHSYNSMKPAANAVGFVTSRSM